MISDEQKLQQGVENGIISREQAERLAVIWRQGTLAEPVSEGKTDTLLSKFLYYLGALIVIGAMSWLMNTAWDMFKGFGLLVIAAGYAAVFCGLARYFRQKSTTLSGLFVVMAVCMTPLAVFGLQAGLDIWPYEYPGVYKSFFRYVRGGWFLMEIATIAVGVLALRYSRIPFAMAPVAFVLWFMSIDITPIFFGPDYNWEMRKQVSIGFGLLIIAIAPVVERRYPIDYAKWLYIWGAVTFWGGLSLLRTESELARFLYCLINVLMMFGGVLINRKIFMLLGGIGFFGYLGYLSWHVFKNSLAFPFSLTALGLTVVYLGWLYHKRYAAIQKRMRKVIPQPVRKFLSKKTDSGQC